MIGIIDLGFSNINSLINNLGNSYPVNRIKNISDWYENNKHIKKIIFPGVGNFTNAMKLIKDNDIDKVLIEFCSNGGHYLGICLGMHILCTEGFEGGITQGLDIISGSVTKLSQSSDEKIPHNGWNEVYWKSNEMLLKPNIPNSTDFYFNHSYHVQTHEKFVAAVTPYGNKNFASIIYKENIFGVQFHPEKSQRVGSNLLQNFIKL